MSGSRSRAIAFCVILFPALALAFPQADPVPGGISIIPLANSSATKPTASFRGKSVLVAEHNGQWLAIIGIPLGSNPGLEFVQLEDSEALLDILPKQYVEQRITLQDNKHVDLKMADAKRALADKKLSDKALATLSANAPQLDFSWPHPGPLSSPFGLQRFFNNQPRAPHSGLDIAAAQGDPIKTPATGKVILVGDFFFNGKTVFIDHGQGVISMFCHMSKINVRAGQLLKQGDVMGLVGKTGRATGPHIHWSLSLNNARVNPLLFLPTRP